MLSKDSVNQVEQQLNRDGPACDNASEVVGINNVLTKKQKSVKFSSWHVKHDKNRDEENEHEGASAHKYT